MTAGKLRWILAAAAFAGLMFVIFAPRRYTPMPRPSDEAFHGRWVLDPASLPSVKKHAGKAPAASELIFGSDGRVAATDMPYEENRAPGPDSILVSGDGRWELELHQDWVITFSIGQRPVTLFIELEKGKPAALSRGVSDPDSRDRWIWRRAP